MLRLTAQQQEVFRINATVAAKNRAEEFIKLNFAVELDQLNGTPAEIVDRVFDFAADFDIKNEINIQRLVAWEVLYNFTASSPIPITWIEILAFPDRDEDTKVAYFQRQIMQSSNLSPEASPHQPKP